MYGRVLLPVKSLFPEAFSLRHCVRTTLAPPRKVDTAMSLFSEIQTLILILMSVVVARPTVTY